MALDGVGLGVALLSELGKIIKSMQERKSCYEEAPALFAEVDETISRLNVVVDEISSAVDSGPMALPQALHSIFVSTLSAVQDTLLQADNALSAYCSEAFFGGGGGGCLRVVANKTKRFFKAKSVAANMNDIMRYMRHAESKLLHLLTQLTVVLKAEETAITSNQNLRSAIEEHVTPCEKFCPGFNPPSLPGNACLDFKRKDAGGNFAAPEAALKSLVLRSTSSRSVAVARGASGSSGPRISIRGASGMPGAGKTIALI